MAIEPTEGATLVVLPSDEGEGDLLTINEGLPPMQNGTLVEIPRVPYTFVVDKLTVLNNDGALSTELFGIRVVLAHGLYDRDSHRFNFLDGQPVKPVVMQWNKTHEETPIAVVVACSGSQVPMTTNPDEGDIYLGTFTPWEKVAYSLTSDIGVTLFMEGNKVVMSIQPRNEQYGFINLEQLESRYGLESQISVSDSDDN